MEYFYFNAEFVLKWIETFCFFALVYASSTKSQLATLMIIVFRPG